MSTHWDQFPPRDSEEFRKLMEEGYREMAEENLADAEAGLPLFLEVLRREDEEEAARRLIKALEAMPPEQRAQTLVRAGILSEDLRLTQRYGGQAPNKE